MARFLIDEMFPRAVCPLLTDLGHDSVHVRDLGLEARPEPRWLRRLSAAVVPW